MRTLIALLLLVSSAFAQNHRGFTYGPLVNYPGWTAYLTSQAFTINESGDRWSFAFNPEEPATVTECCARQLARAGTPGALRFGIQALDSAGVPDGTYIQSGTFTPAAGAQNVCVSFTGVSVVPGQYRACVLTPESGTHDGSNNTQFARQIANTDGSGWSEYYAPVKDGAAAWSKGDGQWPIGWYKSATKTYGRPTSGICDADTCWIPTDHDRGLKFTLPASLCSTAKIRGMIAAGRLGDGFTGTVKLFAGGGAADTTVLHSGTFEGSHKQGSGNQNGTFVYKFPDTLPDITCGSPYRISLTSGAAVNRIEIRYVDVPVTADKEAYGNGLTTWEWTQRSTGNWTDTATRLPAVSFRLYDLTPPAGGGAVANSQSMSGGLQ